MLSRQENLVSAEKDAPYPESCEDIYYNIQPKMLCRTLCWVAFWIELHKNELLEVKVTIDFYRQHHKNLISAQCVNCSGHLVTTKFWNYGLKISNCSARHQIHITFHFLCIRYRKPSAMVCKNFEFLWQEIPYFLNFFSTLKIHRHRGF
jgi:hypothetical protein